MEKRDFDGALNQWQGVKGQVDGFTYWYNLGTLQTLRENYVEARFSFEKARYLTLYSDATEQQLQVVLTKLSVDTPMSAMAIGPRLTQALVFLGPMKIWFLALLVALGLFLSIKKAWSKKLQRNVLGLAAIPLVVVAWFHLSTVAFVALKPIEMYEGPSKVFAGGRLLPAGARILGWHEGDWIKIHDEAGEPAWLSKNNVALKMGVLWGY